MKFDNMQAFQMDANLEAGEGVRVEYPNGMSFVLRRAGGKNIEYAKAIQGVVKKHRHGFEGMENDAAIALLAGIYADTIIIGWSGVTSGGKDVPFTRDNVIALISSYPELFDAIKRDAEDKSLFRAEDDAEEELEKN